MSVVLQSRQALTDQDEIWDYIAADNAMAADDLLDRILDTARLIATQPLMGRARFDLALELRSFPVGEYLIFYHPRDDGGIVVVRILHGRRNITPDLF
jgi:toxin ParE1/3/4